MLNGLLIGDVKTIIEVRKIAFRKFLQSLTDDELDELEKRQQAELTRNRINLDDE